MKQLDDTTFDRPIPGMSMTHELGARPWQTPPTYSTVEETSDYYIERMSNPAFKEQLLDVMEMQIPLTTLANTIQLGSVMEGLHSVDVGMLMIPILVETMMLIGDASNIKYVTGMEESKADSPCKWCCYIYYGDIWCSWWPNEQRFKWRRTYLRCRW